MIDINDLNSKFGIEGELKFAISESGFVIANISNRYAQSEISLYGAHVMSFQPQNTQDILWMSPESSFEAGKPIRGGIPVCFPWFGPHQSDPMKPQHGFGRLMEWVVLETGTTANGETMLTLQLCSSAETKVFIQNDFCAKIVVVVGSGLDLSLVVTNLSDLPFEYSCALHSYYHLSDIEKITISGLQGDPYHSQLEPGEFIQELPEIEIHKAETRHYHNTLSTCVITDPIFGRKIIVAKSGSKITTVWNPWAETCAQIGDLPDHGYKTFVCIEAVNAFDDMVCLAPGESHTTQALIGVAV